MGMKQKDTSADAKCTGPLLPYKDKFDDTFTWVGKNTFGPEVGTQGKCQSGYAFASANAAEATMFRSVKSYTPLSVQQVIDCSSDFGNQGCSGGSPAKAFNYLISRGYMKSAQYPYTGVAGDCQYQSSKKVWQIQNCTTVNDANISLIKSSILEKPVIVSFDATCAGFVTYKSGIYSGASGCGGTINHYMLAVGWGKEKKSKISIKETPYLLLKNSFGKAWGQDGYVKVEIDSSKAGVAGIYKEVHYPYN